MARFLRIGQWNANGLAQHSQELRTFIILHKLDVMLISETHFTNMTTFTITGYTTYSTNSPDGRAHGGSALIIKNSISHHSLPVYQSDKFQATSVCVNDRFGYLNLSASYFPPRHTLAIDDFKNYFLSLGNRFIVGADFNAKNPFWGSRLTTPRGRVLYKVISELNLTALSSNEPTYWPTHNNRIPDVLDFYIAKGMPHANTMIEPCFDLSSDHTPVILTISSDLNMVTPPPRLSNKFTDWNNFRQILDDKISCDIRLKEERDIDRIVDYLTTCIQEAASNSTPNASSYKPFDIPMHLKISITEKRRLRRVWQLSRNPLDKRNFNNAAQNLKRLLREYNNDSIQEYLKQLTPSDSEKFSLWRPLRRMKHVKTPIPPLRLPNGTWAKSNTEKAEAFAHHLSEVFTPFPSNGNNEDVILEFLSCPFQMSPPIKPFSVNEVMDIIRKCINPKKSPGCDLITGAILKELPDKSFRLLTLIFNAMLRLEYFPNKWKIAEIILVPKPGKPTHEITSYRPISLLPVMSKVFEKLLLKRLTMFLDEEELIPSYQFGFRAGHSTIEQIHRVVVNIQSALEEKKLCTTAFLDVCQAFDKVWHTGLLFKIKHLLPYQYFKIFSSFLKDRYFKVKFLTATSQPFPVLAGVPQGSVLSPTLYCLYTSDLPVTPNTTISAFADDIAVQATHELPHLATQHLQEHLHNIEEWQKTWRIKTNENKSVHVTFTMRNDTCPPVTLNNTQLPQSDSAKYLGMHLDKRLTWKQHIWNKRKQLDTKFRQLYWILGRKSNLSLHNKLILYKAVLKPIWTYGIQLWGTSSKSNIAILQRFQAKVLRAITDSPWYLTNKILHRDLHLTTVTEEITRFASKYKSRLENHTNTLALNLLDNSETVRRLQRTHTTDFF